MNCSIVLFRKSYYFYGIWVFILLRNINSTVPKIVLKTVPKFSKNSSGLVVLPGMSEIMMIYGMIKSFCWKSWQKFIWMSLNKNSFFMKSWKKVYFII